jgi:two-component system, cell cycle response regulator
MRVLIAEDDAASRRILQRAVVALGHECHVARDGVEAWELAQAHAIDVIVSDRMMPGMDGIELCRRVRERMAEHYTYFVFLTGLDHGQDALAGMRAGADDYLAKPLDRLQFEMRLIAAQRVTQLHGSLASSHTELKRLNSQLFEQARHDALTGLRNRLGLWEDLASVHADAARSGAPYGVALCDVDYFKRYNDTYGHLAGDEMLRRVAAALSSVSRQADSVYRYGGEEFLLLLQDCDRERASAAAERLRASVAALAMPHSGHASSAVVTLSVGIAAVVPGQLTTGDDVLAEADAALYAAKAAGRNCVAVALARRAGAAAMPYAAAEF